MRDNEYVSLMKVWNLLTKKEMREVSADLGDDIRQARDEKCYSQAYIANRLGITQSAYYKIEAGTVKISMERLMQLAEILGKPVAAFLEKEKYNEQLKKEQKIYISVNELELLEKTISQQEKRIEELEAKIYRRDQKIEELLEKIKDETIKLKS